MSEYSRLNPAQQIKLASMNQKLSSILQNSKRWVQRDAQGGGVGVGSGGLGGTMQTDITKIDKSTPDFQQQGVQSNLKFSIHAYIFVFSVEDPQSLKAVRAFTYKLTFSYLQAKYLAQIVSQKQSANLKRKKKHQYRCKKFFIGNKKDNRFGGSNIFQMLPKSSEQMKFLQSLPSNMLFEASALTNYNVTKIFKRCAASLFQERNLVKHIEKFDPTGKFVTSRPKLLVGCHIIYTYTNINCISRLNQKVSSLFLAVVAQEVTPIQIDNRIVLTLLMSILTQMIKTGKLEQITRLKSSIMAELKLQLENKQRSNQSVQFFEIYQRIMQSIMVIIIIILSLSLDY